MDKISIIGAKEHNLKDVNIEIPKNKLVVITGVSGSGKSSLAFDTIYAEGQRRYVESLSAYARQFLEVMQKPDVDSIEGLSPAISIEQKTTSKNPISQRNRVDASPARNPITAASSNMLWSCIKRTLIFSRRFSSAVCMGLKVEGIRASLKSSFARERPL